MLKITIWDTDGVRLANIERKLYIAFKECHIKGLVDTMSEPPLVNRMNLANRIPVLEINGEYWSQTPGEEFSQAECIKLIKLLYERSKNNS